MRGGPEAARPFLLRGRLLGKAEKDLEHAPFMDTAAIRPARRADLPAITEIYADAVNNGAATYELSPPSLAEMEARFDALERARYPFLVAEKAGTVLGYAYAGPFRARPAYRFSVEDSIYIAPDAKGQGLGKRLLVELIEACRRDGYRQFVAVIGDGRADSPSVILHERVGFRHAGAMPGSGFKHGRWLDTAFMVLELNGGTRTPPDPDSVPERVFREAL